MKVKRWQKVIAKVIEKKIINKNLASGSRATKTVSIHYEYVVNNRIYTNNKVFLVELINGEKGFTHASAEAFLNKINASVEVYANPEKPEASVLYCDGLFWYLFMIIFGAIIKLGTLIYFLI